MNKNASIVSVEIGSYQLRSAIGLIYRILPCTAE